MALHEDFPESPYTIFSNDTMTIVEVTVGGRS